MSGDPFDAFPGFLEALGARLEARRSLAAHNQPAPQWHRSILARRWKALQRARAGIHSPAFAKQFWRRVVQVDDPAACWTWRGKHVRDGYTQVRLPGGRHAGAHRVAWALASKSALPPSHLVVMHLCDNPACVRPLHLMLGTHAANACDRDAKGRTVLAIGERNSRSKLSRDAVRRIREARTAGMTYTGIGRLYGVTPQCVRSVVLRETWRHVA